MSERLSVREFAKLARCDEKQVRRAVEKGLISRGNDGRLAAADVDTSWRRPNPRMVVDGRGYGAAPVHSSARESADKLGNAAPGDGAEFVRIGDDLGTSLRTFAVQLEGSVLERFLLNMLAGRFPSVADAERVKESALALKHLLAARHEALKLAQTLEKGQREADA